MSIPSASDAAPERAGDLDAGSPKPIPEDPRFALMRRLVNILLIVLIAGVLVIVASLAMTLRALRTPPEPPSIAGVSEGDTLVSAEANAERITLVFQNGDGGRRVVILDAATWAPIVALDAE